MGYDFTIKNLGEGRIQSPLNIANFTKGEKRLLFNSYLDGYSTLTDSEGNPLSVELAGPREKIFFDPARTKAAIVTCGGLCPGINDVIRSVTMTLFYRYGVKDILGVKYGLRGLNPAYGYEFINLTPEFVDDITSIGGSILSTSRAPQNVNLMVDYLTILNINILFCVGGEGTIGAASQIANLINENNLKIAIVGIPKTIDKDRKSVV